MSKRLAVYSVIASILTLAIVSCAPKEAAPTSDPYALPGERAAVLVEEEGVAPAAPGSGAADYSSIERLIIRNASLSVVVPDTQAALDQINALVDEMNGYVVESNVYKYQEGLRASVTLRIPAESLDAALERIRALATEVRSENISGQDVTEEYVDLKSRLRYLEATEKKLLEFLEEAEDTEAALAVYAQLREIQAEIEQVKGRMQYLEQSAALATVSLDITPDELAQPIQVGGWHPEGTLRNAFQALVRVLQFLVDAAIVIIVLIAPVLVVIAAPFVGLYFVIRAIVRRRRARKVKTE